MEKIMFKQILDSLELGREIEFSYNNRQYSITNSEGYWNFCCDTDPVTTEKICPFEDRASLISRISAYSIENTPLPLIFDEEKYDKNSLCIFWYTDLSRAGRYFYFSEFLISCSMYEKTSDKIICLTFLFMFLLNITFSSSQSQYGIFTILLPEVLMYMDVWGFQTPAQHCLFLQSVPFPLPLHDCIWHELHPDHGK